MKQSMTIYSHHCNPRVPRSDGRDSDGNCVCVQDVVRRNRCEGKSGMKSCGDLTSESINAQSVYTFKQFHRISV